MDATRGGLRKMKCHRIRIFLLPALCATFAPPRPVPARTSWATYDCRLRASPSDSNGGSDALETIKLWLLARLPDLPAAELELYSACLLNDGYSTPAQLDGINSGTSGRVEDLYFMRKGHRLSLMKQIGGGGNNGREGATGFTSTEVDGEFAIVEEFLGDPQIDDDPRAEGIEETTNPDLSIEEDIVFLQTNSGATLAGKGAVGETETETDPISADTKNDASCADSDAKQVTIESKGLTQRSPSEDERHAGSVTSTCRVPRPDEASRHSAVSLSGEERCARPVPSSGKDRPSELGAVADRLGSGNIAKKTDRSPEPAAASLSRGETRMRPAPSGGGLSDGYRTVNDRTGDAMVSRRAKARRPVIEVLGRGIDARNDAKMADRSHGAVSAALLSRGEARARPSSSGGSLSEGYFTVNDRTGDARATRRTRARKLEKKVLDRAADSTHKHARRRLSANDSENAAASQANGRMSTEAAVPPKILSRAISTRSPSILASLTRAAESDAKKAMPNGPRKEKEEVPLLQSLAGERPRGRRGREDEEPFPLSAAFEPSSLRSLLKK